MVPSNPGVLYRKLRPPLDSGCDRHHKICDWYRVRAMTATCGNKKQLWVISGCSARRNVRFAPKSGHVRCKQECPLSANSGHCAYSMTSSAVASSDCGMVRPSAFAVLRLTINSYLVGACTGMSAGFSPLRMRSTYSADLRCGSLVLGP